MSSYYIPEAIHMKPAPDFVRMLLPIHIGCTYAYLSNSLVIGAMTWLGFALAWICVAVIIWLTAVFARIGG